jgi:hypothetical protein
MSRHCEGVLLFARRIVATVLVLLLGGVGSGLCAGWEATPEARMACCVDGNCPMHSSEARAHGFFAVSQSEADSCCAASEQDDVAKAPPAFIPIISLTVVAGPVPVVSLQTSKPIDAWRVLLPLPGTHVAKHLLLSVFLI